MDFNSWLNQVKIDESELETFITRLELLFTEVGFKSSIFGISNLIICIYRTCK